MESKTQQSSSGAAIPAGLSPQDIKTSKKSINSPKIILRGGLLGAVVGLIPPFAAMIFKINLCHYSLADFGDISSAAGMCVLPALLAGAGLSAAAASIGAGIGQRADLRNGSNHRANRAGWIATGIGLFLSLVIGAVLASMLMFPDC